ncbi:MAG: flagellar biosynthesis anti-sigma factor FlgM [Planctomycetota bacterium]
MRIEGLGDLENLRSAASGKESRRLYQKPAAEGPAPQPSGGDAVEISEEVKLLARLAQIPDIRQETIDAIKAQMEQGNYPTEDSLSEAVRNLLNDL